MSDIDKVGGVPLPLPLRFWYGWAGKRIEVMSGQNILFTPRDYRNRFPVLAVKDGHLHYLENQGAYEWSTLPHGEDPPVFGRYGCKGPWIKEEMTLSEHLILACLFEAVLCHASYGAAVSWLDEDRLAPVLANIPAVAIPPWRWCKTRFFAGRGAFVQIAENPPEGRGKTASEKRYYSVWAGAKTEEPLQFLKPLVDERWHSVAL